MREKGEEYEKKIRSRGERKRETGEEKISQKGERQRELDNVIKIKQNNFGSGSPRALPFSKFN